MVEIIPKPTTRPLLPTILFSAAVILFIGLLIGFFALLQLQSKAKKTLSELEAGLTREKTLEERQLEQGILNIQKKTNDFGRLVAERKNSLIAFQFLQETTHPETFFTKLQWNPQEGSLVLSGETTNFRTLEEQALIWGKRRELAQTQLSNVGLGKESGRAVFDVRLLFPPTLFQQ